MTTHQDFDELLREHLALLVGYGQMQLHCSAHVQAQACALEDLQAQVIRLRGKLLERESQLHWLRADVAQLQDSIPAPSPLSIAMVTASACAGPEPQLPASLHEAHLVICQTGCLSHDNYWRVQQHCQRTGKMCLLVEQPDALRVLQAHSESYEN